MIKLIIVDDQELMRESLKILLSTKNDIEIVAVLKDGEEVVEKVEKCAVDVVLMDIRMPKMDGVRATKIIKEKYPDINIIILTTFDDDEYIFDALKYGASGYLLKGVSLEELYSGIVSVYNGGGIIHPGIASKAMKMFSNMAKTTSIAEEEKDEELNSLSRTEKMIILKIKEGLSNKEIASELSFSEGTIRNYISVILDKLYLRDRTQLAVWAVNHGLSMKGINNE